MNTPAAPGAEGRTASGTDNSAHETAAMAPEPGEAPRGSTDPADSNVEQQSSGDPRDDQDDEYEPLL